MSSDLLPAPFAAPAQYGATVRLAVTWQHPHSRRHEPVGLLTFEGGVFTFRYLRRAQTVDGFQPFLGFDPMDRAYRSERLFPLFSQRVMSPNRPDYARHLDALWLPLEARDWQVLERSQGEREGDGIRVFLEPSVAAGGRSESTFFVNGIRHRLRNDPEVEHALLRLSPGDALILVDQPDNPVDRRAVLVGRRAALPLGWVPSVLLGWVHRLRAAGEVDVEVIRRNAAPVAPAYRLLVNVSGHTEPDHHPFDGPEWLTSDES